MREWLRGVCLVIQAAALRAAAKHTPRKRNCATKNGKRSAAGGAFSLTRLRLAANSRCAISDLKLVFIPLMFSFPCACALSYNTGYFIVLPPANACIGKEYPTLLSTHPLPDFPYNIGILYTAVSYNRIPDCVLLSLELVLSLHEHHLMYIFPTMI